MSSGEGHGDSAGADVVGAHDKSVREHFDNFSARYSELFSRQFHTGSACLFQHRLNRSVELLRGSRGALLDCASGTGEITCAVIQASEFERVVINDFSAPMIERCRERLGKDVPTQNVTWSIRNVFDMRSTFAPAEFDVVLCLGLIAHCGQFPRLMRDMASLLKPGGTLLLQSSLLDHLGDRLVKTVARSRMKRLNYVAYGYYLKDILREVRSAGFEVIAIERFGVCLPFGDRLLGPANYWLEKRFAARCLRSGGDSLILMSRVA